MRVLVVDQGDLAGLLEALKKEKPDVVVLDAAAARELVEAKLKLAERKVIERAKGILMRRRNLDEETAYATLRKAAMDRNLRLGEVAQRIVDGADLLGA